ncbi:hypothetical protein MELA_01352, partial [Candidatus Methylomirabilis lanthanidiphila]
MVGPPAALRGGGFFIETGGVITDEDRPSEILITSDRTAA